MGKNKNKSTNEHPLILKSGATDLRRQEKTLTELVQHNFSNGVTSNVLYGFSNRTNTSIKILKLSSDNSTLMIKIKRSKPYPWPEYKKKGEAGYVVELVGKDKKSFLKEIKCPESI